MIEQPKEQSKLLRFLKGYALAYAIVISIIIGVIWSSVGEDNIMVDNPLWLVILLYSIMAAVFIALTIHAYKTINNKWVRKKP
jgi:hypothetical protein